MDSASAVRTANVAGVEEEEEADDDDGKSSAAVWLLLLLLLLFVWMAVVGGESGKCAVAITMTNTSTSSRIPRNVIIRGSGSLASSPTYFSSKRDNVSPSSSFSSLLIFFFWCGMPVSIMARSCCCCCCCSCGQSSTNSTVNASRSFRSEAVMVPGWLDDVATVV